MKFQLDPLPYELDALSPHISGETVEVHYRKHHAGYLEKLADEILGVEEPSTTTAPSVEATRVVG